MIIIIIKCSRVNPRDLNEPQWFQAPASVPEGALGHWSQCWGEAVKDLVGLPAWPLGQVLVASQKVGLPTGLFIICQTMPHHSFIHSFHGS